MPASICAGHAAIFDVTEWRRDQRSFHQSCFEEIRRAVTKNNTPLRFLASKKSWLVRSFFPTFCFSASASYGTNIKSRGRKSMIKRSFPWGCESHVVRRVDTVTCCCPTWAWRGAKKSCPAAPWGIFLGGPRKLRVAPGTHSFLLWLKKELEVIFCKGSLFKFIFN